MLNWKVVVTAIILLGIIAFFISTQNPVQEFFKFVQEKIDSIFGHTVAEERNISFSLTAEYGNISFEDDVNITINPIIFSADINKMNIETSDTVIMEFSGSGRISGMNLSLDGITNNIKISNSSMVFNRASLKSEAAFTELTIGKLELKELKLKKT